MIIAGGGPDEWVGWRSDKRGTYQFSDNGRERPPRAAYIPR
jgi:hypothetical protein